MAHLFNFNNLCLISVNIKKGSREKSEVAGFSVFSHIRMMGYFRLG